MSAALLTAVAVTGRVALAVRQGTTRTLYFIAAPAGVARLGAKVVVRDAFAAAHLIGHAGGDV